MDEFKGFPARMEFTSVPNLFFSTLLPRINDMTELKVTLYLMAVLYRKRGYPRFVTLSELLRSANLMSGLGRDTRPPGEVLRNALEMAVRRGTVIHLALDRSGTSEDIYLLNTESNREVVARIQSGEVRLSGLRAGQPALVAVEERPDIFTLYEQNIGMLTPMIAEELCEAEKLYPEAWIKDAVKEAVSLNKRNIRYIVRILERWSAEGKDDGTHRRYSKTDPDKYIKGKYGHMVRR
ncbi:MAG: DNA replication protein DnaD [Dehalococcoidales bacterium]|jgi:DnaD/phage-associated family protein|nr:DNA replication protein DnaD [Dehalococcoidales bacterium]MDP6448984.1 DnaD domain protein [Dehalococcoidales bacterium]MDP6577091.1 DnaD domain protein [Dehalococcoidales bacterium]